MLSLERASLSIWSQVRWICGRKSRKNVKIRRQKGFEVLTSGHSVMFSQHGTAIENTISQQLWFAELDFHTSEPVNSQLWHQKRFRKPYIMVDCWLLIDYGKGIIIVFSCVPNSKPTKLYWPFPTLWAHRRYQSKINESQIKIKIHGMWEWDMKVC